MLVFEEWVKNGKINNDTLSTAKLNKKLIEEVLEVIDSAHDTDTKPSRKNLEHEIEEIMDVIQLMVNRLRRVRNISKKQALDFEDMLYNAALHHIGKKIERGWKTGEVEWQVTYKDRDKVEL